MKSVPNHNQAQQITIDLGRLVNGNKSEWRGNSYSGFIHDKGFNIITRAYSLYHWNTLIAEFAVIENVARLVYFDARYISATTRQFQGRILEAIMRSYNTHIDDENLILEELRKSTNARRQITWSMTESYRCAKRMERDNA